MSSRRNFLKTGLAGTGALLVTGTRAIELPSAAGKGPIILSTWSHGMPANKKAWEVLQSGGSVLDAVEHGVAVVESDFSNRSVGLGGLPDRDGKVTLDACIQDHDGRAGSVAFVQRFENPIRIARAVMERTPHVMLVGSGAERWALENGFERKDVEKPEVRQRWQEWLKTSEYKPEMNIEEKLQKRGPQGSIDDHDTIGLIAMDANGRLAGSCTTSGLAWKVHGRVGDSPIIGAGLFVDGDAGAACATGVGELVIRTAGSHTVVELMRQGRSPEEACQEAVRRILKKHPDLKDMQVGFLAIRADGVYGAWSVEKGFNYALRTEKDDRLVEAGAER
jgi:isoaspartyl peptidase/L-asparaginase-like protein (Ntn-hydrolase superfamily)